MEPLLDPHNPLHFAIVLVLVLSGGASAWIGLRDGFYRRELWTSSGPITGVKAVLAGALYLATGLAGLAGGIAFFLMARG
jgi:hypothetical protein